MRIPNPFAWLHNAPIIVKLVLLMALIFLLLVGIGVGSYSSLNRIQTRLDLLSASMARGEAIQKLSSICIQAERQQQAFIWATNPQERLRHKLDLEKKVQDMDAASRGFLRFSATTEQSTEFRAEVIPLITRWSQINRQITQTASTTNSIATLAALNVQGQKVMTELVDSKLNRFVSLNRVNVNRLQALASDEFESSLQQLIASVAVALFLGLGISYLFARQISEPLRELISRLRDIAEGEGDLTRTLDVHRHDEIGELAHWFNQFLAQLRGMVAQIDSVSSRLLDSSESLAQTANETGTGAHQVSNTMEQFALGATEQVQGISKTSEEAMLVSAAAATVSANVTVAAQNSQQAAAAAAAGERVLGEALTHMDTVQGVFSDSAGVVERLGTLSLQIQAIVTLIGGFAKKTNLLALNAGIEAARVGNQGAAFSVLAQEIRTLAVESGNAAQHIAELVSNIQDETQRAVSIMHQGSEGVTEGVTIIHEAGDAFERVVSAVAHTDREIQQIREAAQQLARSAEVMVREMDAISSISEESAAGAEEVVATSHQQTASVERVSRLATGLTKLSSELRGLVTRFTL